MMDDLEKLNVLERELRHLQDQLPKHSIPPSTIARIDELEEEIAQLRANLARPKET